MSFVMQNVLGGGPDRGILLPSLGAFSLQQKRAEQERFLHNACLPRKIHRPKNHLSQPLCLWPNTGMQSTAETITERFCLVRISAPLRHRDQPLPRSHTPPLCHALSVRLPGAACLMKRAHPPRHLYPTTPNKPLAHPPRPVVLWPHAKHP